MTTRVALMKGINLAGHKKVPMTELHHLAASIGLRDPKTYVQSGNLIVDTDLAESTLVDTLETALKDHFGFEIPIISRSADEIAEIAGSHPFSDLNLDDRFLHVAFLAREPDRPMAELIDADDHAPDRFEEHGREVYLAYPGGLGRSKLNHGLLERRLGVKATLRNWRTVSKLADMAGSRPD